MAKKESKEIEEGKIFAFLGVFLGLIGFLIVLLAKKENKYAMFYAKQGLVLFIVAVIVSVVAMFLVFIPFLGWFTIWVLQLGLLALWIIGIVYAFSGEEKDIPLIGDVARKINI